MTSEVAGNAPDLEADLRQYVISHDPAIRDRIIASYLGLVNQLARRFANRGEPIEDLVQVGSIGLINALERFDPDLGFEFSAYVTKTVIGEMKRHFRDKGWSVRAPRRVQELYLRLGRSIEELSQRLGRAPTIPELAREMDAAEQDVIEALEAGHSYRLASIDAPSADGDPMASRLGSNDQELAHAEERLALIPHLERLAERDRLILHLRFVEDLTQSEIAERVGLSQMHVSRLIARSLAHLRSEFAGDS